MRYTVLQRVCAGKVTCQRSSVWSVDGRCPGDTGAAGHDRTLTAECLLAQSQRDANLAVFDSIAPRDRARASGGTGAPGGDRREMRGLKEACERQPMMCPGAFALH